MGGSQEAQLCGTPGQQHQGHPRAHQKCKDSGHHLSDSKTGGWGWGREGVGQSRLEQALQVSKSALTEGAGASHRVTKINTCSLHSTFSLHFHSELALRGQRACLFRKPRHLLRPLFPRGSLCLSSWPAAACCPLGCLCSHVWDSKQLEDREGPATVGCPPASTQGVDTFVATHEHTLNAPPPARPPSPRTQDPDRDGGSVGMSMPRHPGLWTMHVLCEALGSVLGRTVDPTRSGLHRHRLFPADRKLVVFSPPHPRVGAHLQ